MFCDKQSARVVFRDPSPNRDSSDETDMTYECYVCKALCPCPETLRKHMLTHSSENPFRCPTADCRRVSFDLGALKTHMHSHMSGKPCICFFCGQPFNDVEALDQHQCLKAHTKLHSCPQCQKGFNDLTILKRHLLIHSSSKPHLCPHCPKQYSQLEELHMHIDTHLCTRSKTYGCSFCDQSFTSSYYLKCHMYSHTGDWPHSCSYCGQGFSSLSALKCHKLSHPGLFECHSCGRTFKKRWELRSHKCPRSSAMDDSGTVGGEMDTPLSNPKMHLPGHSNKPGSEVVRSDALKILYRCSVCERTFTSYNYMIVHNCKPNVQSEPEILHKCSVCEICFPSNNHLVVHECKPKIHRCPICREGFSEPSDLERHIDEHAGRTVLVEHIVSHASSSNIEYRVCPDVVSLSGKCSLSSEMSMLGGDLMVIPSASLTPNMCLFCGKECMDLFHLQNHMALHLKVQGNPHSSAKEQEMKEGRCLDSGEGFSGTFDFQKYTETDAGEAIAQLPQGTPTLVQREEGKGKSIGITKTAISDDCSDHMLTCNHYLPLQNNEHFQSNKNIHVCPYCQGIFRQAAHLQRHMSIHTVETVHSRCFFCVRGFLKDEDLQRHIKNHS